MNPQFFFPFHPNFHHVHILFSPSCSACLLEALDRSSQSWRLRQICCHTSPSVNVDWINVREGCVCVCVCNEPELLMATLQPQKANNLEIITQSLRQELDTHSAEFLVQLFINSSECLRTHSEEEDGGVQGAVYKLGLYSVNGIYK